jgi:hypothetical protein
MYFLICKIAVLLFCLPWSLTLLAAVMSLAGYISPDTPMVKVVLIRLAWLLLLTYPVVFFALVFFAEKVLARKSYPFAVAVAWLPVAFSLLAMAAIFLTSDLGSGPIKLLAVT